MHWNKRKALLDLENNDDDDNNDNNSNSNNNSNNSNNNTNFSRYNNPLDLQIIVQHGFFGCDEPTASHATLSVNPHG